MAVHESEREDLLREATALKRRVELICRSREPIVAGLRRDGALSVYFGGDPAYHFDSDGRLKRAYAGGDLYRTQGETLARLTRTRDSGETHLLRTDLGADENDQFLQDAKLHLAELRRAMVDHNFESVQVIPTGEDVLAALVAALDAVLKDDIRLAPSFAGRS